MFYFLINRIARYPQTVKTQANDETFTNTFFPFDRIFQCSKTVRQHNVHDTDVKQIASSSNQYHRVITSNTMSTVKFEHMLTFSRYHTCLALSDKLNQAALTKPYLTQRD